MAALVSDTLSRVDRDVVRCERCPRLRRWCSEVARTKVKRFRDEEYWGRPVPGFGGMMVTNHAVPGRIARPSSRNPTMCRPRSFTRAMNASSWKRRHSSVRQ